jgi:preprotein translocase subunit SecE
VGGEDPEGHEEPSLISMMGLVAIVVAVVILVFFALGYVFGRLFL